MVAAERSRVEASLNEVEERLHPRLARSWAIERLDELFRSGKAPDPLPDGFMPGRLLTTSIAGVLDSTVRRIASLYMPWQGKSFDAERREGFNVLIPSAKAPMKVLWPSYEPESEADDRLEVFPFRNRVEPGAVDPDVQVLKIDYDFEANPNFIIRKILDELVEVADGLYLGKILYRYKGSFRPIGFFSLERA